MANEKRDHKIRDLLFKSDNLAQQKNKEEISHEDWACMEEPLNELIELAIQNGENPVDFLTGFFFKCLAHKTKLVDDRNEAHAALLISSKLAQYPKGKFSIIPAGRSKIPFINTPEFINLNAPKKSKGGSSLSRHQGYVIRNNETDHAFFLDASGFRSLRFKTGTSESKKTAWEVLHNARSALTDDELSYLCQITRPYSPTLEFDTVKPGTMTSSLITPEDFRPKDKNHVDELLREAALHPEPKPSYFPPGGHIEFEQHHVKSTFFLASLDCILNGSSEGRKKVNSMLTQVVDGTVVRIRRTAQSTNLDEKTGAIRDLGYVYYWDAQTNEDVFYIKSEKLMPMVGANKHNEGLIILYHMMSFYYDTTSKGNKKTPKTLHQEAPSENQTLINPNSNLQRFINNSAQSTLWRTFLMYSLKSYLLMKSSS